MIKYILFAFILFIVNFSVNAQTFIQGPALIEGTVSTATAAGTTTLTKNSQTNQIFTGVTTQTVVLPSALTIPIGRRFYIANRSTGSITLRDGTPSTIRTMIAGVQLRATLRAQGSAGGTWDLELIKVDLADVTNVTGILPIVNGGTNNSSFTSGSVIFYDGTRFQQDNTNLFWDDAADTLTTANLLATNSVIFDEPGAGTDKITVKAAAVITAWTWTLPIAAGTNKYFMMTDGSGTSSWAQVDAAASITGILPLANGGTNKNMTAVAGGVVWTDADSQEVTAAGSSGQVLQSTGATAPAWTTATYPSTTTVNQLLYSSASNTVAGLASGNAGALVTNGSGVPSITTSSTNGQVLQRVAGAIVFASAPVGTYTVQSKSTTYTALNTDDFILCTGTFTVTMFAASTWTKPISIKNIGTGLITIARAGSDLIEGETSQFLEPGMSVSIVSDSSTNFWVY